MKKIIALLLAMSMTTALAGCLREAPPETTTEPETTETTETTTPEELTPEDGANLTFWAENDVYANDVAAAFEAKYGVPVSVESIGFDGQNKLMLEGPSGNAADVVWSKAENIQTLVDTGVISPIDDNIKANLEATMNETAIKALSIGDTLYGVPINLETYALFYNKDLVTEIPETFEEILETAAIFNDAASNKFYFLSTAGYYNYQFVLSSYGFELFGPDGTDNDNPGLNSQPMIDALGFIEGIAEVTPIASADIQIQGAAFIQDNFANGNTAFMINGPWAINTLEGKGANFGVMQIPTVNGENPAPFIGVSSAFINSYTEYPQASQLFVEFLASEEAQQIVYDKAGLIPAINHISTIKGLSENENLVAFTDQLSYTSVLPTATRMSYIWTVVQNGINLVYDDELSPEEAALKMQEDFDALVASE